MASCSPQYCRPEYQCADPSHQTLPASLLEAYINPPSGPHSLSSGLPCSSPSPCILGALASHIGVFRCWVAGRTLCHGELIVELGCFSTTSLHCAGSWVHPRDSVCRRILCPVIALTSSPFPLSAVVDDAQPLWRSSFRAGYASFKHGWTADRYAHLVALAR